MVSGAQRTTKCDQIHCQSATQLIPDVSYSECQFETTKSAYTSVYRLDDVEDSSQLRRGRPSTHVIFGFAQTINSADFLFVEALNKVKELGNPECLNIFAGESLI